MPDNPITALNSATAILGTELVPVVQGGETKKVAVQDLIGNSYSTTETKTGGTWIDGKPIYRKVKVWSGASLPSSGSFNITTDFPNIETLTPNCGLFTKNFSGENHSGFISVDFFETSLTTTNLGFSSGGSGVDMTTVDSVILTLEYTKTTDV